MTTIRKKPLLLCAALLICLAAIGAVSQSVVTLQRVSLNLQGDGANGSSTFNAISPNGRYFAFRSSAPDIVAGDTNGATDVFVRDLLTGSVLRVSRQGGTEADDSSSNPSVSPAAPNGFAAVVFESDATNLASPFGPPDDNVSTDIYFHLPAAGVTERVSMAPFAIRANDTSVEPSVAIKAAPNRMFVAYSSAASNLVIGDNNGFNDIFLAIVSAPDSVQQFNPAAHISTIRVSKTDTPGREPNADARKPAISGDARFVVYESDATNIFSGVAPPARQIYIYDTLTDATALVSRTPAGLPGNRASHSASVSYSGDFIVYITDATDILTDGLFTAGPQVVRYDVRRGLSERVNVAGSITGSAASGSDREALISPDGRLIIFADESSSLVPGDLNGVADIFLKDMSMGALTRLSASPGGAAANDVSAFPALGRQGYTSTTSLGGFSSDADNLVSGDDEERTDAFLTSIGTQALPLMGSTLLEVPPDVSTSGSSATIRMEGFSGFRIREPRRAFRAAARAKRKPARIRYLVTATNESTGAIRRRVGKRNALTLANLTPGTYSIRYQAQIRRGTRVVRTTAPSPEERISI